MKLSFYALPPHTQTLLVHTISLLNEAPTNGTRSSSSGGSARLSASTAAAAANAMRMFGLVVTAVAQQGSSSADMASLFDMPPSLPVPAGLMHQGEISGVGGDQGIAPVCLLIANWKEACVRLPSDFSQVVVSLCRMARPVCVLCDLRSASADACAGASAGVCVNWCGARYNVMPCV